LRLPKDDDAQRAERSRAVQAAWVGAARVPLENAGLCLRVYQCAEGLRGRTNPNTASDLNCALLLARAGALGCLENVAINLPSIKDEAVAGTLAEQAARLRRDLDALDPAAKNSPHLME
jgi:formiminotetrahydrofolate cyclodeaminase